MNEYFQRLYKEFLNVWSTLNITQRVLLSTLVLVIIAGFVVLMSWIRQPHYVVLYSNLTPDSAGLIVDKLKEQNVEYKLTRNGTSIEVPGKQVYELRLQLAKEGLPEKGETGYELFDANKLGMSDFMQKMSYRRALEGELMRTIQQMEEVEFVRLHIVIPEPALFEEDEKDPTASIVLKLKPNSDLTKNQIRGIAHFVAGSVEGLKPENVTIVDTYGSVLSDLTEKDTIAGLSSSQLEVKKKVDNYLATKIQTLFDQVLGPDNSVVRVDADLDFKQVNRTSESYDPENTSVRSEELVTETGADENAQPSEVEHTTTNYEVNKTIENVLESAASIRRLSVAILVNGIQQTITNEEGQQVTQVVPRSEDELNGLAEIAKNAVGFYEERNDQITVNSFTFDTSRYSLEKDELAKYQRKQFIMSIIHKVVLGLAVLLFLLYVRSLLRKVIGKLPQLPIHPELTAEELKKAEEAVTDEDDEEEGLRPLHEEIPERTKEMQRQQKRIIDFAEAQPEEVSRLVKTWMEEDKMVK